MENLVSKQCRPQSDATICGVYSSSERFACDPFTGFQVKRVKGTNFLPLNLIPFKMGAKIKLIELFPLKVYLIPLR